MLIERPLGYGEVMTTHEIWALVVVGGLVVVLGVLFYLLVWRRRPADDVEDGEQCIDCLRFTYYPGWGCTHCGRSLDDDFPDPADWPERTAESWDDL